MKKLLLALLLLVVASVGGSVVFYKYVKSTLPNIASIQDYSPLLVSSVYDRNGKKIGEFTRERRTLISYEKIPKMLINAFLAAEDDQFFAHKGVNYTAILRATLANLRAGRTVQGGSTITQQVAKTFFLSSEKSLLRKAREALLALQLEEKLGKEEILYLYLNQIFFGQGAYGIVQAAETYFRKKVEELSLGEAAILAGLPKAPSAFTPVRNPSRSKERQAYILRRMAELRMISSEEAENEIQKPLLVHLRQNYDE
ncbi:MAG: transglycosylase domain-containing protein, partial [Bdellovibrio sp.]